IIVAADTCSLLDNDQITPVAGSSLTILPGETGFLEIVIPPLPAGFPSINANCSAFGSPVEILFKECPIINSVNDIAGGIFDVNVYPNPNTGRFTLNFKLDEAQDVNLRILNTLGQEIMYERMESVFGDVNKQINLEGKAAGVYF